MYFNHYLSLSNKVNYSRFISSYLFWHAFYTPYYLHYIKILLLNVYLEIIFFRRRIFIV